MARHSSNSLRSRLTQVQPYAYGNLNFPEPVIWTLGLSYDNFKRADHRRKGQSKVGAQWNITNDLVLRGAFTQFVKPPLANNQTLEPTQVAGFNQLFDDTNGLAPGGTASASITV